MPRQLILLFLLLSSFACFSQDMISVRKKNGITLKTFVAGSPIQFETKDGRFVEGPIKAIRNDSVFVTFYDIRTVITNLGVYMRDTMATYVIGVHYNEIQRIKLYRHRQFFPQLAGTLLQIGGAGYIALNVLNGAYLNQSITDRKNVKSLSMAAGAFGLGFLLHKLFNGNAFSSKKSKIVYLKLR